VKKLSKEFENKYNEFVETYNETPQIKTEEGRKKKTNNNTKARGRIIFRKSRNQTGMIKFRSC